MIGIYKITDTSNNKVYIGQGENIFRRWVEHEYLLNCGTHHSYKLQKAYSDNNNDILKFKFEVEELCDKSELNSREAHYMALYDSVNKGYNVRDDAKTSMQDKCGNRFLDRVNDLVVGLDCLDIRFDVPKKFLIGRYSDVIYKKCLIILIFIAKNIDNFKIYDNITICTKGNMVYALLNNGNIIDVINYSEKRIKIKRNVDLGKGVCSYMFLHSEETIFTVGF